MEKDLNIGMLMDFYGQLLTEKQFDSLDLYYNQDLSLSEIAEEMQISRQGVRDSVKRGEKQLFELEQKLGLVQRFVQISNQVGQIEKMIEQLEGQPQAQPVADDLKQLKKISQRIREKL
jgi:predicted DNA-binding protein YlxM (UPF0122 family)